MTSSRASSRLRPATVERYLPISICSNIDIEGRSEGVAAEVRVRTISVPERRRAMGRRHHLAGEASGPGAGTRARRALRRTLFVFPCADIPMIQAAVSSPLAATLRPRLVSQLERNGTEPPIDGDVTVWLGRPAAPGVL